MLTWKQKCEQERFYEVRKWRWNPKTEEYDQDVDSDLTFEEAKRIFDSIKVGYIYDQVDIYQDFSEDYCERIALKDTAFETWNPDEM